MSLIGSSFWCTYFTNPPGRFIFLYLSAFKEYPHDLIDYMAEEGNVPEEVCLYGSWMHGVGDDVVGLEPPRKLFGHEQVGQLCGAVDSFGIVVPARRYY